MTDDKNETSDAQLETLGDLSDLADGEMRVFEDIGDYGVVVCKVKGELFAVEDNCSHADTPLSTGRLRGHMLGCPLHGSSFDVRDGSHSGPPAYTGVACYKLVDTADGTAVDISTEKRESPPDDFGLGGPLTIR